MTCISCQNKIERKLRNTAGIENADVSYEYGSAVIDYDVDLVSLRDITGVIEKLDYQVLTGSTRLEPNVSRVTGVLLIVISLYILLDRFGLLNLLVPNQLGDATMGYGMLFVIGLVTSIHCIAMCGGINLSQSISGLDSLIEKQSRFSAFVPTFLYNFGRVISYTLVGLALGFAGMLLGGGGEVGVSIVVQGILKLIAGVFMVIIGINMLGLFPILRKLQPRMPRGFARKANKTKARSKSPLIVGLLNGFMPCGPLQSIQIIALASANPLVGGISMMLFSLGTVPMMLGLGSIVSALGQKFTAKVMNTGAVLVVVLGLAMLSQGGNLSGFLPPALLFVVIIAFSLIGIVSSIQFRRATHHTVTLAVTIAISVVAVLSWNTIASLGVSAGTLGDVEIVDGKQIVRSELTPSTYPNITVQAGTPVKWIIDAPDGSINGCNNPIEIPEYGISNYSFEPGENVIEFTPIETGKFQYFCWMGMIYGSITVIDGEK